MTPALQATYDRLRATLRSHRSMLVAYSGGVDSGLLAFVAYRELGDRAHAVLGLSESLGEREERAAVDFLELHGIPFSTVETLEMSDERYRRNHGDRCYFCKRELFDRLDVLAREMGVASIAYGANTDDMSDHRPGARAADEARVVSPLVEAGLDKASVRELARALGLSLWDKPAAPCLASRIPYFHSVTPEKLRQVEAAENVLKDAGFTVCRVRHHGAEATIELPVEDHDRVMVETVWDGVVAAFARLGFDRVALQSGGFRSGRLNDALGAAAEPGVDTGHSSD